MAAAAAQRVMARTVLSLPPPLLRAMSGGGVVYKGGRTLDPRLQFLAAQARGQPPMESLSPEEARRGETAALAALQGDLEPGVRWSPITVPGAAGDIPARLYRPADPDARYPYAAPVMIRFEPDLIDRMWHSDARQRRRIAANHEAALREGLRGYDPYACVPNARIVVLG